MTDQWTGTAFESYNPASDPTVENWGAAVDTGERAMADGIDQSVGGFASVRAPAWHKLGTVFDRPASAEELLVAAGADYPVYLEESAAVRRDPAGNPIEIITDDRTRKVMRVHPVTGAHQILGTASPAYQVFTNRDSFLTFGDALVDVASPNAATCGVLFDGRQAFMSWKLPKGIMVYGRDAVELWLLVHTSHDGSRPLTVAVTPLRTVCQNTCRYNLGKAISRWSIKHTRNASLAIQQAREALKLTYQYTEEWGRVADALLDTPMNVRTFEQIIAQEFGPAEGVTAKRTLDAWDEKRAKLLHLFAQAETQDNIRNTTWGAVQAVGEYVDWGTKVQVKTMDPDGYRFWRSMDGDKVVEGPKRAILRVARQFAGV